MRITEVRAYAVKLPRDLGQSAGTAGSPAPLRGETEYRCAEKYPTVYSSQIETTLVEVVTDSGLRGWGEAQSPVAPEITAAIVNTLLGPMIRGEDALAPEHLWDRMYSAMRVRGQTGGFYLDAIAGIDIAIWDLCGKAMGQPVYRLLGGPCRGTVPYYVSGLAGATHEERVAFARSHLEQGAGGFKVFLHADVENCLALVRAIREQSQTVEIFVDALWRLQLKEAERFAAALADLNVGWLEAPLNPEDVAGHTALASVSRVPIAIGESYRTRFELLPFFERRAMQIVQPDLGRTGLTEARKIASMAEVFHMTVAPHLSIGLGPQIAAAIHFSAACPNLKILECNPNIYETANRFLQQPLEWTGSAMNPPQAPGLGIELGFEAIEPFIVKGAGAE
ncbi:MAG: mandelate racemase/muconate lactonizing enzyme family protein [Acidobacteriaceae bacterium]|nr:mandelate racemase/muconate lactonizing enzyme family protein [Acidobacteriaceae bacterium]